MNLDEYMTKWREDIKHSKSYNGALDEWHDDMEREYRAYLEKTKPLFKADFYAMSKAEQDAARRKEGGTIIWQGNFTSRSGVSRWLRAMYDRYVEKGKAKMREERKNYVVPSGKFKGKKWSGWPNYLTAPNGTRFAIIGMRYPWHTRPDSPYGVSDDRFTQFRR